MMMSYGLRLTTIVKHIGVNDCVTCTTSKDFWCESAEQRDVLVADVKKESGCHVTRIERADRPNTAKEIMDLFELEVRALQGDPNWP